MDGPYRLVSTDIMEDTILCRTDPSGSGSCYGDGFPGPTVFAAEANERYVVIARHPRREPTGPTDGSTTEYYYLIRTADDADRGLPRRNVIGPLTEPAFTEAKRRLGLPEFSRTIEELR